MHHLFLYFRSNEVEVSFSLELDYVCHPSVVLSLPPSLCSEQESFLRRRDGRPEGLMTHQYSDVVFQELVSFPLLSVWLKFKSKHELTDKIFFTLN